MADPNEIAKAKVTVEADLSDFKDAVRETVAETEKLGDAADGAGSRVDASFSKAGEKIEESTKGVRKFVGALSSVAGVATGLIGVVGLVAGAFAGLLEIFKRLNAEGSDEGIGKTRENLQSLFDEISGAKDVRAPVFEALQEEIEDLTERLNKLKLEAEDFKQGEMPIQDFFKVKDSFRDIDDLERRLNGLREQRQKLLRDARESNPGEEFGDAMVAEFRKAADANEAFIKNLQTQTESIRISLIGDDRQRVKEETDLLIKQIDEIRKASGISADNEAIVAYIDMIRQGEAERLKSIDERNAKELEVENEKDRRSQERAQREVETIRQGLESITAGEFTTVLASIPRVLQEVSTRLGRLK